MTSYGEKLDFVKQTNGIEITGLPCWGLFDINLLRDFWEGWERCEFTLYGKLVFFGWFLLNDFQFKMAIIYRTWQKSAANKSNKIVFKMLTLLRS